MNLGFRVISTTGGTNKSLSPVITDVNGGSLDDRLVPFYVPDAGIACFSNKLYVTSETWGCESFDAVESITTENCENSCHP